MNDMRHVICFGNCIRDGFCCIGIEQINLVRCQIFMFDLRRVPRKANNLIPIGQKVLGQIGANTLVSPRDNRRIRHSLSTSARTRSGLPVPFLILRGAAIKTAPVAGS